MGASAVHETGAKLQLSKALHQVIVVGQTNATSLNALHQTAAASDDCYFHSWLQYRPSLTALL